MKLKFLLGFLTVFLTAIIIAAVNVEHNSNKIKTPSKMGKNGQIGLIGVESNMRILFFLIRMFKNHFKTNNMGKYIYLLLLSVIFISCKQQKEAVNYFDNVKTIIEYDSIYSDKNDEVVGMISIDIYKNIIISKNRSTDYFFSFYDIEKKVYLGKWGKRGQGPNDFLNIGSITIEDSQLVFIDQPKKEIIFVSIEQIIEHILNKEENVISIRKESYPHTADFMPLFNIAIVNNKKIALGMFKDSRFGVLDEANNIINYISDYPFNYKEVTGINRGLIFHSGIKSNSKQSKFVIFTLRSDIFEIYQLTDSGIDKIYLNSFNHIPKIRPTADRNAGYNVDRNKSIGGLLDIAVSDDLIYFMYTSKSVEEFYKSGNLSDEVLCYNWDGEKIIKYILPFPIEAKFCVDNEYIYGIREYDDETVIYRFKMN